MEIKLNIAMIGGSCERFLGVCFDSMPSNINKIIFIVDTTSKDNTIKKARELKEKFKDKLVLIEREYEHEHDGANGRARNIYLEYLKKYHIGEWCLVIDPDEIIDDRRENIINDIKDLMEKSEEAKRNNVEIKDTDFIFDVKMEHFIGDLSHIDRTKSEHFAPTRLFLISEELYYPEFEHVLLKVKNKETPGNTLLYSGVTLWHLAYTENAFGVLRRYNVNVKKSHIHTPEFLRAWLFQHAFGTYARKEIDYNTIPSTLKKLFGVN